MRTLIDRIHAPVPGFYLQTLNIIYMFLQKQEAGKSKMTHFISDFKPTSSLTELFVQCFYVSFSTNHRRKRHFLVYNTNIVHLVPVTTEGGAI